jgi:hypothetical protein
MLVRTAFRYVIFVSSETNRVLKEELMYSRKPQAVEIPEEMTEVWTCSNEGCNCWMRNNFAFEAEPDCPSCRVPMVRGTKMLPQLSNYTLDNKYAKKSAT